MGETWSGTIVISAVFGAVRFVFAVCAILVVSFCGISCGAVGDLTGDFLLFFLLRVTWVHPSSLSGWSAVSGSALIATVVASATMVFVVVVVVVVVESLVFVASLSCLCK